MAKNEKFERGLYALICNTVSFYVQAHAAHWNVEAKNFAELHEFFGDLYQDIFSAIDPFAEYLRTHAAEAPCNIKTMAEHASLPVFEGPETATGGYDGADLLEHLYAVNQRYMVLLKGVYTGANEVGDIGLSNFCQDRMAAHRKWMWQMRSFNVA
jgi:starvation-inducible DNA-binding protein